MSTIALDFDATLHPYSRGWQGPEPDDEAPIPGAIEFVRELARRGYRLVVFSTRCNTPAGLAGTKAWLTKYAFMPFIADVTSEKPAALAYVDDRAVPYLGDWSDVLAGIHRLDAADGRGETK